MKFFRGEREVIRLETVRIDRLPNAIGVLIAGVQSEEIESGAEVMAEVARCEGLYRFECVVINSEGINGEDDEDERYLMLSMPDDICFHNERGNFRVELAIPIPVEVLRQDDDGQWQTVRTVHCLLEDLSGSGCRLSAPRRLPKRGRYKLRIPLQEQEEKEMPVIAECLHGYLVRTEMSWRHGMRFVGLNELQRTQLSQEVLERERVSLRLKSDVIAHSREVRRQMAENRERNSIQLVDN